jgi:signal transduction histidine kinase
LERVTTLVELLEDGKGGETADSGGNAVSDEFVLLRRLILRMAEGDGVSPSWRTLRVLDEAIDSVTGARTDRLRDLAARAREAEANSQASAQRQRFLAESSRLLAESLDHRETLKTVARLAVPDIADWCVVDLVQDDGSMARVAVEHRDPARVGLASELQAKFPPRPDAVSGPAHVIRTGKTELETHVSDSALHDIAPEPDRLRLLQALGLNSYISAPLRTRGRILGSITFFTDADRTLSVDDVAMAEDLARRAATAIDNARLYDEAQRAVHAREDILAIVTHDLRTPLAAIVTAAATQAAAAPATEDGARLRRRAETIQRAAQHMTRLIGDLTDLAQIDAGRLAIRRTPHDPAALAREVADTLQPVAVEQGAQLRLEVVEPVSQIDCDGDRVMQVLTNLTSNAVKVGAPTVTIRVEARPGDILFTVSDSGPGIRQEDLPRMFDRYWRAESAQYKGTGLGLPISRGIVTAHGGRIWVISELGVGSSFHFTLPAPA